MPYKSDGYKKLIRVLPLLWLLLSGGPLTALAGVTVTTSLSLYDTPR